MKHIWTDAIDFQYCTLTDCSVSGSNIILTSPAVSGTIVSDIRNSTRRFETYGEIIPSITTPINTSDIVYYRTGYTSSYDEDTWTDWIECITNQTLTEYSLTTYDTIALTNVDISAIIGVFIERLYREGITFLPTARIGVARIGTVRLGDDSPSEFSGDYAENAIIEDNKIYLTTDLNDSENIAIRYSPVNHMIQNHLQYIQWKTNLISTVSGSTSVLTEMTIDYRLDYAKIISQTFPSIYRRI